MEESMTVHLQAIHMQHDVDLISEADEEAHLLHQLHVALLRQLLRDKQRNQLHI